MVKVFQWLGRADHKRVVSVMFLIFLQWNTKKKENILNRVQWTCLRYSLISMSH